MRTRHSSSTNDAAASTARKTATSRSTVRASRRFGTRPLAPSPDDLKQLASYPWPGNVRELAAVIDRAAILGDGKRLDVGTALGIATRPPASRVARAEAAGEPESAASALTTLDAAMRSHIEAALTRTSGRVEGPFGAARLLARRGVDPEQLRNQVTSPNGTTFAGLRRLEAGQFRPLVRDTILAAQARAAELSHDT